MSVYLPTHLWRCIFDYLPWSTLRLLSKIKRLRSIVYNFRYDAGFHIQRESIVHNVFDKKRNVFITGPAGCGKTTVTQKVIERADKLNCSVVVLAPTHAAAELLPLGQTIHSYMKIARTLDENHLCAYLMRGCNARRMNYNMSASIGDVTASDIVLREMYAAHKPKKRFDEPDLIVIDEISMVGAQLLHNLDYFLKFKCRNMEPFGGIQMIFVGDFCQLPPVKDKFAFQCDVWNYLALKRFNLDIPLRQENGDWFDYLQQIRRGEVKHIRKDLVVEDDVLETVMESGPTILSGDNHAVEQYNQRAFDNIPGEPERILRAADIFVQKVQDPETKRWIHVQYTNPVNLPLDRYWRSPRTIAFKVGAKYLITKNLNKEVGITNGRSCVYLGNGEFELSNGEIATVEMLSTTFEIHLFDNVELWRRQVALRLGYAITIHRSQGMTLDKVVCNLRHVFSPGQYYVALSRVRRKEDIIVVEPSRRRIPHCREVLDFYFGNDGPSFF